MGFLVSERKIIYGSLGWDIAPPPSPFAYSTYGFKACDI